MRTPLPLTVSLLALLVFAGAFGLTWLITVGDDAPALATPASVADEPAAAAPAAAPVAAPETAAVSPGSDQDVAGFETSTVDLDADRQARALARARATATAAIPESDAGSIARVADPAASAKGLAVGERIGSHSSPRFAGNGTFRAVSREAGTVGGSGRVVTYAIEIENGLAIDDAAFVGQVTRVLSDRRSWIGSGRVQLRQVASPSAAQYTIRLSSPAMTDRLCAAGGMSTEGIYSCRDGRNVVMNYYRWMTGAYEYPTDPGSYRIYMINHEFGHAIGHGHRECGGAGSPAPVMLQQSISSRGCSSQPWPLPSELAAQG